MRSPGSFFLAADSLYVGVASLSEARAREETELLLDVRVGRIVDGISPCAFSAGSAGICSLASVCELVSVRDHGGSATRPPSGRLWVGRCDFSAVTFEYLSFPRRYT